MTEFTEFLFFIAEFLKKNVIGLEFFTPYFIHGVSEMVGWEILEKA